MQILGAIGVECMIPAAKIRIIRAIGTAEIPTRGFRSVCKVVAAT